MNWINRKEKRLLKLNYKSVFACNIKKNSVLFSNDYIFKFFILPSFDPTLDILQLHHIHTKRKPIFWHTSKESFGRTGRKRHNMNCVAETKAMSPSMSCDPQRSKRRRKGWHVWPPELPKGVVNCIFLRWVLTGEICLDRCCLTFLSLNQCCQL